MTIPCNKEETTVVIWCFHIILTFTESVHHIVIFIRILKIADVVETHSNYKIWKNTVHDK